MEDGDADLRRAGLQPGGGAPGPPGHLIRGARHATELDAARAIDEDHRLGLKL